ncbi:hypothetical protein TNCV_327131 [Trichonephila clavipes]|nr:hypothetical protein TNCV_327131 [Trichonephila clavipes]
MAQKGKLDYYDDDFDFDTESLSSFESDEDCSQDIKLRRRYKRRGKFFECSTVVCLTIFLIPDLKELFFDFMQRRKYVSVTSYCVRSAILHII